EITIQADGPTARVACDRSHFRLPAMAVENLPARPTLAEENGRVELAREEAIALFARPLFAASAEQTGEAHYWMTAFNFPSAFLEFMKTRPIFRDRSSFAGRALLEGHVVHSPDVLADPDFTYSDAQKLGGYRTVLCVPLLREGSPI